MSRVEEIEAAIESLPPEDYRRVVQWLQAREHPNWDKQIEIDSASGKLDFLFEEANQEAAQRKLREWPAPE
jgi:hypothetical protein